MFFGVMQLIRSRNARAEMWIVWHQYQRCTTLSKYGDVCFSVSFLLRDVESIVLVTKYFREDGTKIIEQDCTFCTAEWVLPITAGEYSGFPWAHANAGSGQARGICCKLLKSAVLFR